MVLFVRGGKATPHKEEIDVQVRRVGCNDWLSHTPRNDRAQATEEKKICYGG